MSLPWLLYIRLVDPYPAQANVLIGNAGTRITALLSDFGLATVMAKESNGLLTSEGFKGSYNWSSPEVAVHNRPRTLENDVWSWGCLALEVRRSALLQHFTS